MTENKDDKNSEIDCLCKALSKICYRWRAIEKCLSSQKNFITAYNYEYNSVQLEHQIRLIEGSIKDNYGIRDLPVDQLNIRFIIEVLNDELDAGKEGASSLSDLEFTIIAEIKEWLVEHTCKKNSTKVLELIHYEHHDNRLREIYYLHKVLENQLDRWYDLYKYHDSKGNISASSNYCYDSLKLDNLSGSIRHSLTENKTLRDLSFSQLELTFIIEALDDELVVEKEGGSSFSEEELKAIREYIVEQAIKEYPRILELAHYDRG